MRLVALGQVSGTRRRNDSPVVSGPAHAHSARRVRRSFRRAKFEPRRRHRSRRRPPPSHLMRRPRCGSSRFRPRPSRSRLARSPSVVSVSACIARSHRRRTCSSNRSSRLAELTISACRRASASRSSGGWSITASGGGDPRGPGRLVHRLPRARRSRKKIRAVLDQRLPGYDRG